MRLGHQVKRSCRDAIAARSDPGHGPARPPDPQADRPAALRHLGHRDHRAWSAAGVAASATTTGVETDIVGASGRLRTPCSWWPGPWRCSPSSSSPSRWPSASSSGARCSGSPRRWPPGSWPRSWRPWSTSRCGARSRPALRRDHHVAPGRQPRRGAGPVPGRPGGLRDDHRPVRAAGLAERPVAGHRRLRARPPGRPGHHRPVVPDHAARRAARSAWASGTWRAARRCGPARRRSRPR